MKDSEIVIARQTGPLSRQEHMEGGSDARVLAAEVVKLQTLLEWAVDLIDKYDEFLVSLGEPREKVYSDIHVQGKALARAALSSHTEKEDRP